ncbi:MAG: hypothetical protein DI535_06650 [Citrobacter freundii]|nr:MAG: hypothetical protein DI535_06650 [Citrobacter freundii]
MRILLSVAVMLFSASAFAQTTSNPALQSLIDKFNKDNPLNIELPVPPTDPVVLTTGPKQPVYSHTLPSGAPVFLLPQDNMPCVVPNSVSNMPVARGPVAKPGTPGAMPNAGYSPMVMAKPAVKSDALLKKR